MKKILLISFAILALVLVGLLAYFQLNNVEKSAMNEEARKGVAGKFIQLSNGITHYEESGADSIGTVVLVHGFSVPYYIWDGTYDSLVAAGFHVVRYDAFGRGYSARPDVDYTPEFYRKQLYELIQQLNLKTPIHLAGLSFGGAITGDFVSHYPNLVNKVILVDPVYRFKNSKTPILFINYFMALKHEAQATGQLEDVKYPEKFPDWVDRYKVQMQFEGFRNALASTIVNYSGDSIIANYKKLDSFHKDVLLIWGKEDITTPFAQSDSLNSILHTQFFPVENARHLPHLEYPSLVNSRIILFLK